MLTDVQLEGGRTFSSWILSWNKRLIRLGWCFEDGNHFEEWKKEAKEIFNCLTQITKVLQIFRHSLSFLLTILSYFFIKNFLIKRHFFVIPFHFFIIPLKLIFHQEFLIKRHFFIIPLIRSRVVKNKMLANFKYKIVSRNYFSFDILIKHEASPIKWSILRPHYIFCHNSMLKFHPSYHFMNLWSVFINGMSDLPSGFDDNNKTCEKAT